MILWIDEAVCCLLGIVYLGICIDRTVSSSAEERKLYRATQIEGKDVLTVDVLIVTPILEDVWESRQVFAWLDRAVTVVSLEGLTKMKLMAGRHQDLADLENLGIEFGDEDQ